MAFVGLLASCGGGSSADGTGATTGTGSGQPAMTLADSTAATPLAPSMVVGSVVQADLVSSNYGQIYRLYQAAFNRKPDTDGLYYWIARADGGMALDQIAAYFIASPEFLQTYGSLSNLQLVNQLYQNVLHRQGEAAGVTYWLSMLDSGKKSRAEVLTGFSESDENIAGTTTTARFNIDQALSDGAQSTTLAFSGFGMMTGNLGAQTFFPPGKVADYWGFQYLRDNDPDDMGHNTSFLTRVSSNMLYILNDAQVAKLKALASAQVSSINLYGWKRYPLMKAFRRLIDGAAPSGSSGLSLDAIKAASRELYVLDGQISYDRAVVYADIFRTLTTDQKKYLDAMVGKGYGSWPDKSEADVRSKTQGLINDEVVAMMTYAGDMYSWYAGSITADVYFCPERHGTYFGSFFIKDAPAVGHPGYGIDETMTATVGSALVDSRGGYISAEGAAKMNALVTTQKQNLYANATANIVLARTQISQALRSLITSTAPSADTLEQVRTIVVTYSAMYGELDGENNYSYASTFNAVFNNVGGTYLTAAQKSALAALRKKYMTVTYADGTTVDYSGYAKYYLYAAEVQSTSSDFVAYTSDTVTSPLFLTH